MRNYNILEGPTERTSSQTTEQPANGHSEGKVFIWCNNNNDKSHHMNYALNSMVNHFLHFFPFISFEFTASQSKIFK